MFLFEGLEVSEGDRIRFRKERSKSVAPVLAVHERKSAAGQAVKCAVGVEQAGSTGMGAGKFYGSLDAFAARAGKKYFRQAPAGTPGKTLRQFARQFRNVALQHNGSELLQLVHDGGNHVRVIVAHIVNTVSGKEIENAAAVRGEQFGANAAFVVDGEFQHVEQFHPLRVHVLGVEAAGCNGFRDRHSDLQKSNQTAGHEGSQDMGKATHKFQIGSRSSRERTHNPGRAW